MPRKISPSDTTGDRSRDVSASSAATPVLILVLTRGTCTSAHVCVFVFGKLREETSENECGMNE